MAVGLRNKIYVADTYNKEVRLIEGYAAPTQSPTFTPTVLPTTRNPTVSPSESFTPTQDPTPVSTTTVSPSQLPTSSSIVIPSQSPTFFPTVTVTPSTAPTVSPIVNPTSVPTQGNVVTFAGSLTVSQADALGTNAVLKNPSFLDIDDAGVIYFTDSYNNAVKSISLQGIVSRIAGNANSVGSTNGVGSNALFNSPSGVALDGVGSAIFIADSSNQIIRRLQN